MKINFWVPAKMLHCGPYGERITACSHQLHCGPEGKGLRPAATRHPKIARLGSCVKCSTVVPGGRGLRPAATSGYATG